MKKRSFDCAYDCSLEAALDVIEGKCKVYNRCIKLN